MQSHRTTTQTKDNYSKNNHLNQQLANALIKIQYLKELNAQLIQQNSLLMRNNANLLLLDDHNTLKVEDRNKLVDHNLQEAGNSYHLDDDSNYVEDVLNLIAEKIRIENDNSIKKADNINPLKENTWNISDNKHQLADNKSSQGEHQPTTKDHQNTETDHNEVIILNGTNVNKAKLIKRLLYIHNIVGGKNYSEEQLITAVIQHSKDLEETAAIEKKEKISKVPALYLLNNPDLLDDLGKHNNANLIESTVQAFASLKKRGKKNMPAMKRQTLMLFMLYKDAIVKPRELFTACKLNPVSGFRYATKLRKLGFLSAVSRGTSSQYSITNAGKEFLENIVLKNSLRK